MMAQRSGKPATPLMAAYRGASIVALNLAHAVMSTGGSLPARLAAIWRGTRDYVAGRVGDDR